MSDTLFDLGIYPDAIENAVELSESLVAEATDCSLGVVDDLNESALAFLKDNIDAGNITNSIILAYFCEAVSVAKEVTEKIGVEFDFDYYVNGDDSHIFIKSNNAQIEYNENHEFVDEVQNRIIAELDDILSDIGIDPETVEAFVESAGTWEFTYDSVSDLLQSITIKIAETIEKVLGTDVMCEINEDTLVPKFTIYKEGGNIADTLSGSSFMDTFRSEKFCQVLKGIEQKELGENDKYDTR